MKLDSQEQKDLLLQLISSVPTTGITLGMLLQDSSGVVQPEIRNLVSAIQDAELEKDEPSIVD